MCNLNFEINSFFRSWQAFELNQSSDRGVVFDFDFSQDREQLLDLQFNNRFQILEKLIALISTIANSAQGSFANKEFVLQKMLGAEAYLRQLLGEKIPFDRLIQATLGIVPELVGEVELDDLRENLREKLDAIGVKWLAGDSELYDQKVMFDDVAEFSRSLERHAVRWVQSLKLLLGFDFEPDYNISVDSVDEYWANWITGTYGSPIELRINTHPRIKLRKGSDQILAAHEIAGHAMHIRSLSRASLSGNLESCCLNTSLHGCEMFQMEGLAQSVLFLLAEPGEIDPLAELNHFLNIYHLAILNNAQIEMESGRPIEEVLKSVQVLAPFLSNLKILSDLRDRSRNPIFRSLIFVYYPSWKMFSKAQKLPAIQKKEFLRSMYSSFWTPRQIDELL